MSAGTCPELGVSRSFFYRWRKRYECLRTGRASPGQTDVRRRRASRLGHPRGAGSDRPGPDLAHVGRTTIAHEFGPAELRTAGSSTVFRRRNRLGVVEHPSGRRAGLPAQRTRERLLRTRYGRIQHVEAELPGDLACLDRFSVGRVKVQTGCRSRPATPPAPSATLRSSPPLTARPPRLPPGDLPGRLQRSLMDPQGRPDRRWQRVQGRLRCRSRRTRHPSRRHGETNAFTERSQKTIFGEHWRIALRSRYFTSGHQLRGSLTFQNHTDLIRGTASKVDLPPRSSSAPCSKL